METGLRPDRRPAIAICAWDPNFTAWDPVEDLSGDPWNPVGARTLPVPGSSSTEALAAQLSAMIASGECGALLLVGRTAHPGAFRLQMRAENRCLDRSDRLDHTGPGVVRATAPTAEIVRDLAAAGLSALAASDAEEDAGSYILYRILNDLPDGAASPAIGLIRAPSDAPSAKVQAAVKTAASVIARHLAPLPRSSAA
ncbi:MULTISPECIES: hypothetical protein [unclassified Brevundimonas]|uniref:hypothetical protein n=1 Tax=unclassified Brevundimonas TaxID=2622653 RepID=UPI000CFCCEF3|nr:MULTISPECIES: hypothetical protein [unclassified Brevundimonas]PRA30943.1 hypothetical protein CQ024_07590 [Brevundimonas sp. MYb27]PQZ82799.1 hypothetical protein CQ026_07290 [Brevundimonas sp. MYb31]PRB16806.1 hypothetical protein CQ039_03920 [Brevundimonas sp. MYb52]PRB34658.1 hypothetical protein CQ035_09810 [Brevundimonas sp. MYb46]PRB54777.1 hypothetical protein CQ028_04405 [Brevundimonas sp. MYb33]